MSTCERATDLSWRSRRLRICTPSSSSRARRPSNPTAKDEHHQGGMDYDLARVNYAQFVESEDVSASRAGPTRVFLCTRFYGRALFRFQGHAAFWTFAGAILHDFRMHWARVLFVGFGFGRRLLFASNSPTGQANRQKTNHRCRSNYLHTRKTRRRS